MPNSPESEAFEPFSTTAQKMIDYERAKGNAHFSERNIKSHNIDTLALDELDDVDCNLIQLYKRTLENARNNIFHDAISEDFYFAMCKEFRNTTRESQNTTQNIFRAYMNNRFGALILTVQMYLTYKNCGDKKNMNEMAKRLQEEAQTYLQLLEGVQ